LTVPLGDASDFGTIDAGRAEAGKPDASAAIAQRNGGDEAIVAWRRRGAKETSSSVSI
jgi:hypothetical protein